MRDVVVWPDARLARRRVVDGRYHLHDAIFHRDLNSETAEFAARLHLHVPECLGRHVARMRIERGQHAVDGIFDQLGVIRRLDVIRAHALEYVAEEVELAVGVGVAGIGRRFQKTLLHADDGGEGEKRTDCNASQDRLVHLSTRFLVVHQQPGAGIDRIAVFPELDI